MKKTIVVKPERTETYTEMVPVQKTRIVPAETKEVEVGPGYAAIYQMTGSGFSTGGCQWHHNGGGKGLLKDGLDLHDLRTTLTEDHLTYLTQPRSFAKYAWLYIPEGVTVADALEDLNKRAGL